MVTSIKARPRAEKPDTFDRPPPGWFALNVMKATEGRKWDWVALMVDVDPVNLKHCDCAFPALFFVDPNEWRPAEGRTAHQCYVTIPGKHRNAGAAWEAIQDAIEAALN
jgi:hypothetical protein